MIKKNLTKERILAYSLSKIFNQKDLKEISGGSNNKYGTTEATGKASYKAGKGETDVNADYTYDF